MLRVLLLLLLPFDDTLKEGMMMILPVVVLSVQVHRWIVQGLREFDSERIMILWVNQQTQHELRACFDPTEFVYKTP